MITAPTNWDTLWNDVNSIFEVKLEIYADGVDGIMYFNDDLASCRLDASAFNDLSLGNACSARLSAVLKNKANDYELLRRCKSIWLFCRLKSGNGSTVTSWVRQGIFYIDAVMHSNHEDISITAYDILYRTESFISQQDDALTFASYLQRINSMYDAGLVLQTNADIADGTYLKSSSANLKISNLRVDATAADQPARDVIGSIAALAGGNFIINKSNQLQLLRLDTGASITTEPLGAVVTAASIDYDKVPQVVTGVDVDQFASASGWRIVANVSNRIYTGDYAPSINMAKSITKNMYTTQSNVRASNIHASGAFISPLVEIGDIVSVDIGNGKYYNFTLCEYSLNYSGGCWGTIGANKSDSAISFSFEESWNSSVGWYFDWYLSRLSYSHSTLVVDGAHTFHLDNIILDDDRSMYVTVAHISDSLPATPTVEQNIDTINGTYEFWVGAYLKRVELNGIRIKEDYPIERRDNTNGTYISNVYYYSEDEIPEEFFGLSTSGPLILGENDVYQSKYGARIYWN